MRRRGVRWAKVVERGRVVVGLSEQWVRYHHWPRSTKGVNPRGACLPALPFGRMHESGEACLVQLIGDPFHRAALLPCPASVDQHACQRFCLPIAPVGGRC